MYSEVSKGHVKGGGRGVTRKLESLIVYSSFRHADGWRVGGSAMACKRWQLNIGNSGVSERQKVSSERIASKIGCSRGRDVGCPSKRSRPRYENSQWRTKASDESIVAQIRFDGGLKFNFNIF